MAIEAKPNRHRVVCHHLNFWSSGNNTQERRTCVTNHMNENMGLNRNKRGIMLDLEDLHGLEFFIGRFVRPMLS